jgi:hypothetical protein
MLNNFN